MARLIDADSIIKKYDEYIESLKNSKKSINDVIEDFIEIIEKEPTAYDVEKMSREVEEKLDIAFSALYDIKGAL